nr:MAG TPA: hypothetical protein [Caudoviricetes sp.]
MYFSQPLICSSIALTAASFCFSKSLISLSWLNLSSAS